MHDNVCMTCCWHDSCLHSNASYVLRVKLQMVVYQTEADSYQGAHKQLRVAVLIDFVAMHYDERGSTVSDV